MHRPVLLQEVSEILGPKPGQFLIDGTMDGGGHAAMLLSRVLPKGHILGVEWDEEVSQRGKHRIAEELGLKAADIKKHLLVHCGNYRDLPEILRLYDLPLADGLLLDLGFSSEQLELSGRGFSFLTDEPLIMTYGDDAEPVRDILRRLLARDLADVIYRFGGERFSRQIAQAIKDAGKRKPIETSKELAEIVKSAVPRNYEHGRIHPATRTFQALRIYANQELENVADVLKKLPEIVKPGGRVAMITFHSLEDKLVKESFREYAKSGKAKLLVKKPVTAGEEEIKENPRSRSAKLRGIEMV